MRNDQEATDVVLSRLRSGASNVDAVMELLASGYSRDEAADIVSAAATKVRAERNRQRRHQGNYKMIAGAFFLLIGVGSMVYTYFVAAGLILLPFGILALGGYLFFTGMSRV